MGYVSLALTYRNVQPKSIPFPYTVHQRNMYIALFLFFAVRYQWCVYQYSPVLSCWYLGIVRVSFYQLSVFRGVDGIWITRVYTGWNVITINRETQHHGYILIWIIYGPYHWCLLVSLYHNDQNVEPIKVISWMLSWIIHELITYPKIYIQYMDGTLNHVKIKYIRYMMM